jgi:glycosyltransferase involved in cell wall biosynthesis
VVMLNKIEQNNSNPDTRMKILIVSMNVGKTAPAIVFEKLIRGLSATNEIDLLVADYYPSAELRDVSNIIISKRFLYHGRLSRLLTTIFCLNPFDYLWAWKSKRIMKNKTSGKYDCILCFIDACNYAAVLTSTCLAREYGIRFAVHTTDALPPPVGWLPDNRYYKSFKKMMARYLRHTDAFFSTNQQMLNYQLNSFTAKKSLISNIIYNPGLAANKAFPPSTSRTNNFVYTGGIYGVRRAEYVIKGFEKLLEIYPESRLVFVGSHISIDIPNTCNPLTLSKIIVEPYTADLDQYYESATALLDIDADLDNDVFISSKMPIYLMVNRIIISETGKTSPSRIRFKGINSIFQCDHDPDQLCQAMKKAIENKHTISFDDRKEIIKLFKLENIVEQINISLKQMASSKLNVLKSEPYQNQQS